MQVNHIPASPLLLSDPALGSKLLSELRQICPELPATGVVAGQSLCSLILRSMGDDAPINDIDIFTVKDYEFDPTTEIRGFRSVSDLSSAYPDFGGGYEEAGSQVSLFLSCSRVGIRKSWREGLLNHVLLERSQQAGDGYVDIPSQQLVVSDFDINCVQIGVDIASETIYFTAEFEDFIRGREIYPTSVLTPITTAIRLLNKHQSIPNTFLNVDKQLSFLAEGMARYHRVVSTIVGDPNIEKYDAHAEVLNTYFSVSPLSALTFDETAGLYTFAYRLYRGESLASLPSVCPEANKLIDGDDSMGNPAAWALLYRLFSGKRAVVNKLRLVFQHGGVGVKISLLADAKSYLSGNVSKQSICELNRFFTRHPYTANGLKGVSMEAQLRIKRQLCTHEKRGVNYMVGLVERSNQRHGVFSGRVIAVKGLDWLEREYNAVCAPDSLILDDSTLRFFGCQGKQLLSVADLVAEGSEQSSCVGGYGDLLASDGWLFSLSLGWRAKSRQRTTLLLRRNSPCGAFVSQHYCSGNQPVNWFSRMVAIRLADRINGNDKGLFLYVLPVLFNSYMRRPRRFKYRISSRVRRWVRVFKSIFFKNNPANRIPF